MENNADDVVVRSETSYRISRVEQPVETSMLRLKRRRDKLQRMVSENLDVEESVEDFSDRLKKIEKQQEKQRPVSATFDVVKKQRLTSNLVMTDIKELESCYNDLTKKVGDFTSKDQPQKDIDAVEKGFEKLKVRWEKVKDVGEKRCAKTTEVERPSDVYHDKATEFVTWLTDAEQRVPKAETKDKHKFKIEKEQLEVIDRFFSLLLFNCIFSTTLIFH